MEKILISVFGIGLIGFIYWFFFSKKEEVVVTKGDIDIKVDGGYNPSVIKIKKGESVTFNLKRTDSNTCLEEFILPDFKVKEFLPLNEKVSISITPQKAGEYPFHCGMNMFHGKVIVQ